MIFNKDTNIKQLLELLTLGSVVGISFQKDRLVKDAIRVTMVTDTNYKIAQVIPLEELYKTNFEVIEYLTEKMTSELQFQERIKFNADSI
ncbi:MAG: hypothetical protein J6R47_01170 [Acholeplasmatales bacterium]|nr:hypothetical protein [Acholeplasmatales bacterium]